MDNYICSGFWLFWHCFSIFCNRDLGFANLFADGFSMAISDHESSKAEAEYFESIKKSGERHIEEFPEGEREEIILVEERSLSIATLKPSIPTVLTFLVFVAVGAIVLMPYIVSSLEMCQQFSSSAFLAGTMVFLMGMLKSLAPVKPVFYLECVHSRQEARQSRSPILLPIFYDRYFILPLGKTAVNDLPNKRMKSAFGKLRLPQSLMRALYVKSN